jgi:hypothetical protein
VTELYAIHLNEQTEAYYRDFLTEWREWPRKLANAGMPRSEIDRLRACCWHNYLVRRGFLVDDFNRQA